MSPRRSAADARETRESIVAGAVSIGSLEGLESLSFGRVAEAVHLSKSGVTRHFSTKEELQLAALAAARRRFREEIWEPAADRRPGLERLRAVMGAWLDFLQACPLPGGCLVTAAATEFDGRSGPVHDAVVADAALWRTVLEREIEVAVRAGELPADTDAELLAFELGGIALATNQAAQLHGDRRAAERARRAVERLLDAPC
ncbi:MAG: TetR/AcrR family transcriptional regulator [Solirubrobacteraceae bacterium]